MHASFSTMITVREGSASSRIFAVTNPEAPAPMMRMVSAIAPEVDFENNYNLGNLNLNHLLLVRESVKIRKDKDTAHLGSAGVIKLHLIINRKKH